MLSGLCGDYTVAGISATRVPQSKHSNTITVAAGGLVREFNSCSEASLHRAVIHFSQLGQLLQLVFQGECTPLLLSEAKMPAMPAMPGCRVPSRVSSVEAQFYVGY